MTTGRINQVALAKEIFESNQTDKPDRRPPVPPQTPIFGPLSHTWSVGRGPGSQGERRPACLPAFIVIPAEPRSFESVAAVRYAIDSICPGRSTVGLSSSATQLRLRSKALFRTVSDSISLFIPDRRRFWTV